MPANTDQGPTTSIESQQVDLPDIEKSPLQPTFEKKGPSPRSADATSWPQEHKLTWACAARDALISSSVNAGRKISPEEIVQILDQSPNYVELCEILERRGFIIDRGHFARVLLAATANPFKDATDEVKTPTLNASAVSNGINDVKEGTNLPVTHEPQLSNHVPSKKEMAKKRSFGELIDLTIDLPDDGILPPAKKSHHGLVPRVSEMPNGLSMEPNTPLLSEINGNPAFISNQASQERRLSDWEIISEGVSRPLVPNDESHASLQSSYPLFQRELLRNEGIVCPMNKKADALRRSTYNPKTIARDVLVTAGKHPTMAPLNHHLDALRKVFRNIDFNSNLSTLRWDLIDPGEPPASSNYSEEVLHARTSEDMLPSQDRQQVQIFANDHRSEVPNAGKYFTFCK